MTTEIKRWGNSLALRIPKDLGQTLGLAEGSQITLTLENGRLVVTPRRARLGQLLAALETYGADPHGEVSWGEEVGEECF